jgi:diacylglycerol O-acyltransferase / wax synthase
MSTEGRHLDRLTAVDASFLTNETSASHMHVGAILIFEGPPPKYVDLVEHVRSRLGQVPRFRQRLVVPPLEAGRPLWADDVNFNLTYHIRHSALPEPGGEEQLRQLAGRVFSQQLDRSKPLWELWLVQGMERDRFAILTKTHHAMVDGISGVDIGTVLFDLEPTPPAPPVEDDWIPHAEPSTAQLVARAAADGAAWPLQLAERAVDAIRHPEAAARKLTEALEGVAEVVGALADPAPDVPLNRPIGPHRRFAWASSELATFKRIKDALGGTVNDVVLAVVTGALREWLHSRGIRTEGLELRALVPVSIRSEDERGQLGNRIAAMRGPLPVYVVDPVRRLQVVREAMGELKQSKQALGAEVISRFNDFAPPTLLAQASRINFSTRLFNLIVTNVPGPQIPLYVLGRELEEVFPVAFLPENHALAIAIMSYNGRINFGLLADYDAMEDVEIISEGISDALQELLDAAKQTEPEKTASEPAGAEAEAPAG